MNTELPWFQDSLAHLIERASLDSLPHSLLVAGPKGIGKLVFAQSLAKKLLGQSHSQHPDYFELSPQEGKKNISVDQVRDLIQRLSQTPHQNGYKIAVIYPAETMNIAASNALLKTLEEPYGKTLLILCTHQESRLLPTISSRCQRIKLKIPSFDQAKSWLSAQLDEGDFDQALNLTENRPLAALALIQNERIDFYKESFKSLNDIIENKVNPITIAESWAKEDVEEVINLMQIFVRGNINIKKLFTINDKLTEAKRTLQTQSNPNKQLLLENLLTEFICN